MAVFLCFTPCTSHNLVGEMEKWVRKRDRFGVHRNEIEMPAMCLHEEKKSLLWITKWSSIESHKSFYTHEWRLKNIFYLPFFLLQSEKLMLFMADGSANLIIKISLMLALFISALGWTSSVIFSYVYRYIHTPTCATARQTAYIISFLLMLILCTQSFPQLYFLLFIIFCNRCRTFHKMYMHISWILINYIIQVRFFGVLLKIMRCLRLVCMATVSVNLWWQ